MANLAHSIASFTSFCDTGPLRVRTGTVCCCCCCGGGGGVYTGWGGGEYARGADAVGGAYCCAGVGGGTGASAGVGVGAGALQLVVCAGGAGGEAGGAGGFHLFAGVFSSDVFMAPIEADCVNDGKSVGALGGTAACGVGGAGGVYAGDVGTRSVQQVASVSIPSLHNAQQLVGEHRATHLKQPAVELELMSARSGSPCRSQPSHRRLPTARA